MIDVMVTCPFCGETSFVTVPMEGLVVWMSGEMLIQEALPEVSASVREQLISGICPDCWNSMFGEEEE